MQIIAQVAADWTAPLAQIGVAGAMLVWFATRLESRLKAGEKAIDRMAKALLLSLVAVGQLDHTVKEQAQILLDEIEGKGRAD